jgi:signal transduction histidine kinase
VAEGAGRDGHPVTGASLSVRPPSRPIPPSRVGVVRGFALLWRWQAAHPRRVDGALAAVVFVAVVWGPFAGGDGGHGHGPDLHLHAPVMDALTVVLLAVAAGALVLRRSYPLVVWGVVLVAGIAVLAYGGDPTGTVVPSLLALYTVGSRAPLTTTVSLAAVTVAAYGTTLTLTEGQFSDRTLSSLAFLGVAAAVGVAVRSQRAAVEAAEARARQAEATREEEAERRVTDERLRIARELHDVVAHHISVVNVQAGVARHLLDSQPEQARDALTLVREASRTVLSEMSTVLGLLRTGEDETPTAPAPGLDGAGALVESMRRAGLEVTERVEGEPYALPEIADLTAFRVVQESLTNALKHGTGTAELKLEYSPTAVVIEIRNPVRDVVPPSTGGGHGLVGMRERVTSLGGRFTADPQPDGWFTVRAEIRWEDGT